MNEWWWVTLDGKRLAGFDLIIDAKHWVLDHCGEEAKVEQDNSITDALDRSKLTNFIYILARDYFPFGQIENLTQDAEDASLNEIKYPDENQEKWARSIVDRLVSD